MLKSDQNLLNYETMKQIFWVCTCLTYIFTKQNFVCVTNNYIPKDTLESTEPHKNDFYLTIYHRFLAIYQIIYVTNVSTLKNNASTFKMDKGVIISFTLNYFIFHKYRLIYCCTIKQC